MIFIFGLGTTELFIIFLVALLLFGAKNIPKLARSLGRATKEFKNAKDDFQKELYEDEKAPKIEEADQSVSKKNLDVKDQSSKDSEDSKEA